jgi:hypothetical protein
MVDLGALARTVADRFSTTAARDDRVIVVDDLPSLVVPGDPDGRERQGRTGRAHSL